MRLVDAESPVSSSTGSAFLPPRRESAALRLLRSGELGAHLLHLSRGAAAEHLAHMAQEASPAARGDGEAGA
jgi:hypothetical protein